MPPVPAAPGRATINAFLGHYSKVPSGVRISCWCCIRGPGEGHLGKFGWRAVRHGGALLSPLPEVFPMRTVAALSVSVVLCWAGSPISGEGVKDGQAHWP